MNYLGIDLSKKYFDGTLELDSGEQYHAKFSNDEKGFKELINWLNQHGVEELHACMEATNIYWEGVAAYLYNQSYIVSVVNPMQIKGFAMSQLCRNKTDKLDSQVIATFCKALSPTAWTPPSPEQRQLRDLVRHRDALIKARTQQKNRLADCLNDEVRRSIETIIATLNAEIDTMEKKIKQFIKQSPQLTQHKELLLSITSFGETTVHIIMAEMHALGDYENAKAAAADAGVYPSHQESGDTVRKKPKMGKMGNVSVRKALYWPAVNAIKFNPIVKAMAQRMEKQNKPKMVIIGAAMRKLIHIAYGVLKNKTPFDPQWEHSQTTATP